MTFVQKECVPLNKSVASLIDISFHFFALQYKEVVNKTRRLSSPCRAAIRQISIKHGKNCKHCALCVLPLCTNLSEACKYTRFNWLVKPKHSTTVAAAAADRPAHQSLLSSFTCSGDCGGDFLCRFSLSIAIKRC